MKNLGIFYLIFMVLFSIVPCNDETEIRDSGTNNITKAGHQTVNSEENCSPICVCTCCGQHIVTPLLADFKIQVFIQNLNRFVAFDHFELEQRAITIWQPPKLS